MGAVVFSLLLLAMAVTYVVGVRGFPSEAQIFPRVIGIPTIVLIGWQIARELSQRGKTGKEKPLEKQVSIPARQLAYAGLWIVASLVGIYLFGFLIAVTAYVVLYLLLHKEKWFLAVSFGVFIFLFMQFLVYLLSNPLYGGLLSRFLESMV